MDIRLIAVDLDGTLLTSAREVHPAGAASLRRADELGIQICFASGRNAASVRPFAASAGVCGSIVSCNGAYVLDASGVEVHHNELPRGAADIVFDYCQSEHVQLNLYSRESVFIAEESEWSRMYIERVRHLTPIKISWKELRSVPITKLLMIDSPDRIQFHRTALGHAIPDGEASQIVSEAEYLEFLAPGVNKSTGVQRIARIMGIEPEHVAAIGDYENDVELLRWAGYSGAVANAPVEVKSAASRIFASNDEGGVAEFIGSIVYND